MLLIPTYVVQILSSFNKTLIFSNGLPEVFWCCGCHHGVSGTYDLRVHLGKEHHLSFCWRTKPKT